MDCLLLYQILYCSFIAIVWKTATQYSLCDICFGLLWMALLLWYLKLGYFWFYLISLCWNRDSVMSFGILWRPSFCRRCCNRCYFSKKHRYWVINFQETPVTPIIFLRITGRFASFFPPICRYRRKFSAKILTRATKSTKKRWTNV